MMGGWEQGSGHLYQQIQETIIRYFEQKSGIDTIAIGTPYFLPVNIKLSFHC